MNITATNLNLLVALEALLDERSVTLAAKRIGVSQPTMSHHLKQLRALFNDRILVSVDGRLSPTPLAQRLSAPLRAGLSDLQRVLQIERRFDPKTSKRRFCISTSDYFQWVGLSAFIELLRKEAPSVDLMIVPQSEGTLDALASGAVDLLLGTKDQAPPSGVLEAPILHHERFVVLARHGHPLIKERLTLSSYCKAVHATVASDDEPTMIDQALKARGRTRRVGLRVPDYAGLGRVIAATDLIATVPSLFGAALAKQLPLTQYKPPVGLATFSAYMFWHPRFDGEEAISWLRAMLLKSK